VKDHLQATVGPTIVASIVT